MNNKKILTTALSLITVFTCFFSSKQVKADGPWPSDLSVASEAAIVMDMETGTILYEKNIDKKLYPASITKIMTVLLAIENCDLNETLTFSKIAVAKNENAQSSHIARDVGEQMTLEQTLYATMVASANECAWAVGEHVAGGDIEKFVDMMNEKAQELGCTNTHFANPNGLHNDDHYVTARDMAKIATYAFSNEKFAQICSTKKYTIPPTNKHSEETYMSNHHAMFNNYKTRNYLYDYCIGGKTGYTTEAGNTLVTFARKDGMTLVCVVLKNPGNYQQYTDTKKLFDFAFDNFKKYNISQNFTFNNDKVTSTGRLADSIDLIKVDESASIILPKTASFKDAKASVVSSVDAESQSIGLVKFTYAGKDIGSAKIQFTSEKMGGYPFDNMANPQDLDVEYVYPVLWPFFVGGAGVILVVGLVLFIRSKAIDIRVFRYRNITQKRRPKNGLTKIHRRRNRW